MDLAKKNLSNCCKEKGGGVVEGVKAGWGYFEWLPSVGVRASDSFPSKHRLVSTFQKKKKGRQMLRCSALILSPSHRPFHTPKMDNRGPYVFSTFTKKSYIFWKYTLISANVFKKWIFNTNLCSFINLIWVCPTYIEFNLNKWWPVYMAYHPYKKVCSLIVFLVFVYYLLLLALLIIIITIIRLIWLFISH